MTKKEISKELRAEQTAEAKIRMQLLGLNELGIIKKSFENEGAIWTACQPLGILIKQDTDPETLAAIEKLESTAPGSLPYHAIRGTYLYPDGNKQTYITLLYVSTHPEEWEDDRDDLMNGRACAYVYNCNIDYFSEIGYVGIKRAENGTLAREY